MADGDNRFTWKGDEFKVSQCFDCVNKHQGSVGCNAFPDGIPDDILDNSFIHTEAYPGDNGIRYQQVT